MRDGRPVSSVVYMASLGMYKREGVGEVLHGFAEQCAIKPRQGGDVLLTHTVDSLHWSRVHDRDAPSGRAQAGSSDNVDLNIKVVEN